jgi:hypothetical protein
MLIADTAGSGYESGEAWIQISSPEGLTLFV